MNDYIKQSEQIYYKHKTDENMPCNAYSTHTHNNYEIIYFIDGDATHVIEDRKYKLKKHDLIIIRPFHYHFIQIDSASRYERINILFDADKHSIEGIDLIDDSTEVINLENNVILKDIFKKMDIYKEKGNTDTFNKILVHLISELFYGISLLSDTYNKETLAISPIVSKAVRYINDNIQKPFDTKDIAQHLFISESYLFRLFKNELRSTPKKYITKKRLLIAQKLLYSGSKPTEIYDKCGFADYTSFYRNYTSFFKRKPSSNKKITD